MTKVEHSHRIRLRCSDALLAVGIMFFVFASASVGAAEDEVQDSYQIDNCSPFESSRHYRTPTKSTVVTPDNWIEAIDNSVVGEEILLEDGVYSLEQYAVVFNSAVTIRSASGQRDSVVIEGQGFGVNAEALMVMADDVTIADLTIRNVRDHAISLQQGVARTVIYNVNLVDIGTQHIKGNLTGPHGVIACSEIGYSSEVSKGDYNSAIDMHGAVEWTIRDNYIYNIYGDGSGCAVDDECGIYFPGGEPAILLWRGSRDNTIVRNTIVGSYRGISLGLDTPYTGGIVKDNFVCRNDIGKKGVARFIEGDTGISLIGASHVDVSGNKVLLSGEYHGPIEVWKGLGNNIYNNTTNKPIWNRGDAEYNGCLTDNCDDERFGNDVTADEELSCPQGLVHPMMDITAAFNLAVESASHQTTTVVAQQEEILQDIQGAGDTATSPADTASTQLQENGSLIEQKEKSLQAVDAHLALVEVRLQQKQNALLALENQMLLENRLKILELQQQSTQFQFDVINRRLGEMPGK